MNSALISRSRQASGKFWMALSWALFMGLPAVTQAQFRGYLTDQALYQQLDAPLTATRARVGLRDGLKQLGDDFRVAVLLDRRIDPDQVVNLAIDAAYFDEGIADLVEPLKAEVRVVGNTVYVAPRDSAATIRTRVELARRQLELACEGNAVRRAELKMKFPVSWLALTSPRGIAASIASRYKLKLENPTDIPHDLWAAGSIASADAAEAFLLVVSQFDMGVEWVDADTVRFVPLPENPVIEASHRVRDRAALQKLQETLQAAYPERKFTSRGLSIVLSALLEEHDEIDLLLGNKQPRKPATPAKSAPLSQRRIKELQVQDVTLSAISDLLRSQGIPVVYDSAAARAAGIDVDQLLTVTLKDATLEQLLEQTAGKLGLAYRVEEDRIVVEGKKQ